MWLKFFFDRLVALLGLLVLWPVLLLIAILIRFKMEDGPVLFQQQRVGRNARIFTIYKFRTMSVHTDNNTVTVSSDARITPLGRILRTYKLDELPELWNVLKGDMSFVGPRPDVPGYADKLQGEQRKILFLRPGITGPATLKYRNEELLLDRQLDPKKFNDEVIFPDKVRINLYYLNHYSFWKDLCIIFCTIFNLQMNSEREPFD